jgi:GT2 family glycosyltransferase
MKAFVVVATKGRPQETYQLLNSLSRQTHEIEHIIVAGSNESDIAGLEKHPLVIAQNATVKTTDAGLTIQRNAGLDFIMHRHQHTLKPAGWFVVFFDDDFRLTENWIEACASGFESNERIMGIGGQVLADGITGSGFSELESEQFINGEIVPQKHIWSGEVVRNVPDLYGCNMAYRGSFAIKERFDENLPFYGWLEDVDYSVRASKKGELIYLPTAIGVHMGVPGGRTSGVRFGYSQLANPVYLLKKNTMPAKKAWLQISRNVVSNVFHTLTFNDSKDFKGRLYGNFLALFDLCKRKCHPSNVKSI